MLLSEYQSRLKDLLAVTSIEPDPPSDDGDVINVGPGMTFEEPHQVPWHSLAGKPRIRIHYRSTRYRSKITINTPCIVEAVKGPNGEPVVIDAREAFENPNSHWYTDQVSKAGIFTVCPAGPGSPVDGVVIDGFTLMGARRENEFTDFLGRKQTYWNGCAGVSLYKASNVTIRNCDISDNENGTFGTTSQGVAVRNTLVEFCRFGGNGRNTEPAKDRVHNAYLEGIGTIWRFNTFDKPIAGSAGCNLKDRGAGTLIMCNVFEGGARIIDLVDPEAGSESGLFQAEPLFGKNFLIGNVIANPLNGGSTTMVNLGFDGWAANGQHALYALWNTFVNKNVQAGGRYRTYWFKASEGFDGAMLQRRKFFLANNIFHTYSPVSGQSPSETYMMTEEGGWAGADVVMRANWVTNNIGQWYYQGVNDPKKPDMDGWAERITGADPGITSPVNWDFMLLPGSLCRGKAVDLATLAWPNVAPPSHSWTPTGWQPRTSFSNLGAAE